MSPVHLVLWLLYVTMFALREHEYVAEAARVTFGLIGLVAAFRAAREHTLPSRQRQAWRAVAVSFVVLVASPPLLMLFDGDGTSSTADDITHIAFVLALLIALLRFPLAPMNTRDRWKTGLDAGIVLVGGTMVLFYTSFGPYVEAHGLNTTVLITAVVYPVADLALLFVVARALLRGSDESAQHPLRLLTAGTLVLFAGDAVHGYLKGGGQLELHSAWQFVCWLTADALLAAAAVEQSRVRGAVARSLREQAGRGKYLPYAAIAVAHLLMLAAAVKEHSLFPWGGLALGGATLSALVLFRQTLVQRESDEQAVTDPLTGLANRSLFRATSNAGLVRGAKSGRSSAVLVIDMNGFKEVNDTLGHKSGDQVLIEFSRVLRDCVPAAGLPCRLGGDEFAVVLADLLRPEEAYEVAGRLAAAMGPVVIEGKLIALAASIGVAVSAPGELTHDEIVHRGDLAMYRAKSMGPDTRWAIWTDSLEAVA
ncbi:GGDEF domain-containing protein [Actinoplanes sp. NPDC051851]|uniref:GGDEF domain-containing protein n=1 Tax=Actinoplanes sp. NPDC051851 TaxID=3154753 RepID=UPI003449D281